MSAEQKVDLEKTDTSSEEKGGVAKTGIEYERAQLLANLPDPDAGKTDDERREIVRFSLDNSWVHLS